MKNWAKSTGSKTLRIFKWLKSGSLQVPTPNSKISRSPFPPVFLPAWVTLPEQKRVEKGYHARHNCMMQDIEQVTTHTYSRRPLTLNRTYSHWLKLALANCDVLRVCVSWVVLPPRVALEILDLDILWLLLGLRSRRASPFLVRSSHRFHVEIGWRSVQFPPPLYPTLPNFALLVRSTASTVGSAARKICPWARSRPAHASRQRPGPSCVVDVSAIWATWRCCRAYHELLGQTWWTRAVTRSSRARAMTHCFCKERHQEHEVLLAVSHHTAWYLTNKWESKVFTDRILLHPTVHKHRVPEISPAITYSQWLYSLPKVPVDRNVYYYPLYNTGPPTRNHSVRVWGSLLTNPKKSTPIYGAQILAIH